MSAGKMPDEAELQALYRDASAASADGPGGEIDARILGAARAAAAEVQAHRRRPSPAWWQRWLVPVSVTAVAVLGVSLTLRVSDEQAALEAARMAGEAPVLGRSDAARSAAPAKEGATAADEKQSADQPLAKESSGPARPLPAPLDPRAKRAPAPFPAAESALPTAPSPLPASPTPLPSGQLALPSRPAPSADKSEGKRERADTEYAPSAPALAPPPAAIPAPQLSDRAGNAAKAATASKLGESSERRARAAEADQEPGADLSASGALSKSRPSWMARQEAETTAIEASPERWLEHIRTLRRAGRLDEARLQLDRFRQRYPDRPLPDDLK